jgi:hypothetical protein
MQSHSLSKKFIGAIVVLGSIFISTTSFAQHESKTLSKNPWKPVTDAIVANLEQRLQSFAQINKSLLAGKKLRGVFDYKKCEFKFAKEFVDPVTNADEQTNDPLCKMENSKKADSCYGTEKQGPDAIGGLGFDTWEFFGPEITKNFPDKRTYVTSSDTKLISIRGFVLNYGSVKVYDNNAVQIKINYLNPKDYTIQVDEKFNCKLSNGSDENGASFFLAH